MFERKERFGFRKSKVYKSLCGAILGAVAILTVATTGSQVFADEATSPDSTMQVDKEEKVDEAATVQEIPTQTGENTLDFTIDSTTFVEEKPRNLLAIRDDSGSFRYLKDDKGNLQPSNLPAEYVNTLMSSIIDSLQEKDKMGYFSLMEADGIPANTGKDSFSSTATRTYGASVMTDNKQALKDSLTSSQPIVLDDTPKDGVYFDDTANDLAKRLGYTGDLKDLVVPVLVDDTALYEDTVKLLQEFQASGAKVLGYIIKTDFKQIHEKSSHEYFEQLGIPYEYLDYTVNSPEETQKIADKLVDSITRLTVTKTTPGASIVIRSANELSVTTAVLTKPDGSTEELTVSNGAVNQTLANLADGAYKVDYTFEGKVTSTDTMKGQVLVAGKVVDEKEDTRSYVAPVIERKEETRTEAIPHKTIRRENASLPEGQERLVQKGKDGVRTFTDVITLTDGKETDRQTSDKVTTEPVDEIVEYGTKKARGKVLVHYVDTEGNMLATDRVDLEGEVGTAYNTAENDTEKPITITKDGKTYELVPTLTKGKETGQLVEGTTEVTYVYKLREEAKVEQPKQEKVLPKTSALPQTGESQSHLAAAGVGVVGLSAFLALAKMKKEEKETTN